MTSEPEWILVTVLDSGYRKPVRRSAIVSYGTYPGGTTFVDIAGRTIEVRESEQEIACLVWSPFVAGIDIRPQLIEAEHERQLAELKAR